MNRKFVCCFGPCALSFILAATAFARQPNIILIMADDLGFETITANGGESYQTPHLDRLAATGVRFEHCYVQPLCTPTRVELMTGLSNVRNYIRFGAIDAGATTFAHLLKNAGYATAVAGKWQLGKDKPLPRRLGFDESCLWQHTRRPSRYASPGLEYDGQERDFRNGEYGPDLVNDFALDFITRHEDEPFLLYYPMMLAHAPYQPTPDSEEWDPEFNGAEGVKDPKYFADMVATMDKLVGSVTAKLDDLGLRDDTLIIFLGDNGTGSGITSQFKGRAYHGGKGKTNARGMHVPLIVNWTNHVPAGNVSDDLVGGVDFLPTLCEAAGVQPPESLALDGRSFLSQALGKPGAPREWLYTWYAKDGGAGRKIEFARTKTHKLYAGGRFYDLSQDPFEDGVALREDQLTGHEAEVAKQLRTVLNQYADARPPELQKQSKAQPPRRARPNHRGANRQNRRAQALAE